MNQFFHLTMVSANKKTGPIPVSISSSATCPPSCAFYGTGCYAKYGPLKMHWDKVSKGERGGNWEEFLKKVKQIARGQFWRYSQAGDLPGNGEVIDGKMLSELVKANQGKQGFTYTHKYQLPENHAHIQKANKEGFTVNLSANTLEQVDKLKALNIAPVVTVLPSETKEKTLVTKGGNKVVVCPATYKEGISCATCQLCQKVNRSVVVGFPAHGTAFRKVDKIIEKAA